MPDIVEVETREKQQSDHKGLGDKLRRMGVILNLMEKH